MVLPDLPPEVVESEGWTKFSLRNDSRADELVAGVKGCELAWGDGSLRGVEDNEETGRAEEHGGTL